ncbi:acyl-CoA synthetase [Azospirillum argentinense]|uniref:acyl-CoA synthetase n=1 Tax=Azospirillum argentinense TaxID=2970906 RepID=UPI00190BEACF|nr:acyl-CoA synthetase [Azospirillum argentinense]MBK3800231.1 AMP-binding protein [Azospirillum argentinense]
MTDARHNPYETDLDQNAANTVPLSPLSFLRRTAAVYPQRIAVIHGPVRRTWAETYERCVRLASALAKRGIGLGDTVAVMAPNTPESFEAHFGVPMTGAVLNALNIRLDAEALAFILEHGEAKVLLTDREFSGVISKAVHMLEPKRRPIVIDIDDPQAKGGELIGEQTYEQFLETGDPAYEWPMPADEWQAIALNYTSGTTGNPKGVVYHHRGAYLNAMGNVLTWAMPHHPVYLWTLPMFHCNGWCFPWTVTAMAGTNVCVRTITAKGIYDALADLGVTHMCGAPIIMGLIVNAPEDQKREIPRGVKMMTAGAAPPAAVIEKIERMGFDVTHVYGLTEVYGPVTICAWHEHWNDLPLEERAALKARQGVNYATLEGLMVADPNTLQPTRKDGVTMGEIFMRGNTVMKGYLKNPRATQEAFSGGWFHTGDLGVWHPDGYIELKDRSKDIIISGGENISTIEVESVLYKHPDIVEAAVVARPDEKWGETPCAFVTVKEGKQLTEAEVIAYCREHLAHFKCPRTIVFTALPKTSTGKIQKYVLRDQARALNEEKA